MEIKSIELSSQVTLPYVEQGDPAGVPLLLLHGFAGSWRSFERVLRHLPASIHAFALTQRGHGEASKPQDGYRLDDWAEDLAAFVDARHLEDPVIAGHSMGSAVALHFAANHPREIQGLVLVGACLPKAGGPQVQAFWDSTVSKLTDPMDPAFVRGFLESTLAQPVPQAYFERVVADSLKVPARVWKASWQNRLEGTDLSGELARIETPTLIIWGDQDSRCPRSDQEALAARITDSRLVVYPGAGHGLPAEEPGRFVSDLVDFVQDLTR